MKNPIEKSKFLTKNSTTINTFNQNNQSEEPKFENNLTIGEMPGFRDNSLDNGEFMNNIFNHFNSSDDIFQNPLFWINNELQNNETQDCNGQFSINLFFDEHQNYESKKENNQVALKEKGLEKENSQVILKEKGLKKEKKLKKFIKNIKRKRYNSKDNIEKKVINNEKKMFNIYKVKEDQIKIGNNIKNKNKSKRESNQFNMIKRNLIQDNFRTWINFGETEKIVKLNPKVLGIDFDNKTLKDIYSQTITKKAEKIKKTEKETNKEDHNIKIIKKAEGKKKVKLNLRFNDALKLFFENLEQNELQIQQLKENNGINENINCEEFLKGLQKCEQYLKGKGGESGYSTKLEKTLIKFKKQYIK